MKNAKYWQKRFEALENTSHNKAVSFYDDMDKIFTKAQSDIDKEISGWMLRFGVNNQMSMKDARKLLTKKELKELKWNVDEYIKYGKENAMNQQWMKQLENASAKVHMSRLDAINLETQHVYERMFGNYTDAMDEHILETYKDGFYHSVFEVQKGIGTASSITGVDEDTLKRVLEKPWSADGINFSDRIWQQKTKLVGNLQNSIAKMCIQGTSVDKLSKELANNMNTTKAQAKRLILTESAHFSSLAENDAYKEMDVNAYEVLATLDEVTCEICGDYDGEVYKNSEMMIGLNAPPFHPNCRCTTVPHFDDNFEYEGTRATRNDKGKSERIKDMSYSEWKKNHVVLK